VGANVASRYVNVGWTGQTSAEKTTVETTFQNKNKGERTRKRRKRIKRGESRKSTFTHKLIRNGLNIGLHIEQRTVATMGNCQGIRIV